MKKTITLIAGLLLLLVFAQCKKETIEEEPSTDDVELTIEVVETIANDSVSAFLDEALEGDNLNGALPVVAQRLMGMKEVKKAEVRDDDIEITFVDGTSLTIMFRFRHDPEGEKPSPQENNKEGGESVQGMPSLRLGKKVLVWEPFSVELSPHGFLDLVQGMGDAGMQVSSCEFNDCTISSVDNMTDFDYIIIHTHGTSGGNWFCTHEIVTPEKDEIYNELLASHLVGKGHVHYVDGAEQPIIYKVSGDYIRNLQGRFNNSIVFAGFCHGMDNGGDGLCNAFHDKGASVFCGFDGSVSSRYDDEIGTALAEHLVYDRMSMGEAYDLVRNDIPDRPRYDSDGNVLTHNMFRMDERSDRNAMLFDLSPEDGDMPVTRVFDAENITNTTATLKGQVISAGNHTIVERGFVYSYVDAAGNDVYYEVSAGSGLGCYSCDVSGLMPNTWYYYTTWVKIEDDVVIYNEEDEKQFQTVNTSPTVITKDVEQITYNSAVAKGKTIDNTDPIMERGFCYGTENPILTAQGEVTPGIIKVVFDGGNSEEYSCTLTDLEQNTIYRLRAYALTEYGPVYGEKKIFTTPSFFMPEVTLTVSDVTTTSVGLHAQVYGIHDSDVQLRGFCCGTSSGVEVGASGVVTIISGSGLGTYDLDLTGLIPGTTYYVKAFAQVDENTISYSEERTFITLNDDPQVVTLVADNVTDVAAVLRGGVVGETSQTVTERGFCYGTSPGQGIGNYGSNKIAVSSGMGAYFYNLENLTPHTTYYVKAYAITDIGHTIYGEEVSFITLGIVGPVGAVNGLFSVGVGKQVFFSHGNLQYRAVTNTWRFAENQWDYLGNNGQAYDLPGIDRDLFGWGTSGYNHGAECYEPWCTSTSEYKYYAYGSYSYNLYDQTGQADWGYNAISNGGGVENYGWRTLTKDEWNYVFNTRATPSGIRFVKACVNDVCGVILLPDDWDASYYPLSDINQGSHPFRVNVITASDWMVLEQLGAVFLPAAGYRDSDTYSISNTVGSAGKYWSSSVYGSTSCNNVFFSNFFVNASTYDWRCYGYSVRLVRDAE